MIFQYYLKSFVCVVCFKGYSAKAGLSNGRGKHNGKYHVIITCYSFGSKI